MNTHEDTARRFLFGLNQLDALKNATAATKYYAAENEPILQHLDMEIGCIPQLAARYTAQPAPDH